MPYVLNTQYLSSALIPGLPALVMHHCTRDRDVISITVVDTLTLRKLDSRQYAVPCPARPDVEGPKQGECPAISCAISCGCGAVAVSVGNWSGYRVYQLNGCSPGELLFFNADLMYASWSSCGSLLAGIVQGQHDSIAVLDRRSGCSLATLAYTDLWSDHRSFRIEDIVWQVSGISWTGAGQLHVQVMVQRNSETPQGVGVLFCVCDFV